LAISDQLLAGRSKFKVQSSEFKVSQPFALRFLFSVLSATVLAVLLAGCTSLPKPRPEWSARQTIDTQNSSWARTISPAAAEHPGSSGVDLFPYGLDALSARLALADSAERTLDLQYYIWMPDTAGKVLADRVLCAADRGVRVRILLDDMGGTAPDEQLLLLSSHTNVEVRIFNPIANRTFRKLSTLFDLKRVNHRMHNKSFTADRTVTILGGRNIADHYFGLGAAPHFADFDVIAAGPAVGEVTASFEQFWYSASSIPIEALLKKKYKLSENFAVARSTLAAEARAITNSPDFKPLFQDETAAGIRRHDLSLTWGPVRLVRDLPEKINAPRTDPSTHLLPQLSSVVTNTTRELLIISPYFVPGEKGLAFFRSLRNRGVRVVVLSNSLAAQDVTVVHAGYRRYRKPLLLAGVEMWEMRPDVEIRATERRSGGAKKKGVPSGSSLHMKTLVFDRQTLFVGSLNLTPRSSSLNTEMGLIIEIPKLAEQVARMFEQRLVGHAYRLEFVPGPGPCKECGHIEWISQENGREVSYHCEPHASFGKRLSVSAFSLLPIESQL
jgi:putative cardiolipin synthase